MLSGSDNGMGIVYAVQCDSDFSECDPFDKGGFYPLYATHICASNANEGGKDGVTVYPSIPGSVGFSYYMPDNPAVTGGETYTGNCVGNQHGVTQTRIHGSVTYVAVSNMCSNENVQRSSVDEMSIDTICSAYVHDEDPDRHCCVQATTTPDFTTRGRPLCLRRATLNWGIQTESVDVFVWGEDWYRHFLWTNRRECGEVGRGVFTV